jgi:hypothetical protein
MDPLHALLEAVDRLAAAAHALDALWAAHPDLLTGYAAPAYPADLLPDIPDLAWAVDTWRTALRAAHPGAGWRLLWWRTDAAAAFAAQQSPPFGPSWDAATADRCRLLTCWGTDVSAPADACRFRGFDADGAVVADTTLPGY